MSALEMTESTHNYQQLPVVKEITENENKCLCIEQCFLKSLYGIFIFFTILYDAVLVNTLQYDTYEEEQHLCKQSNIWMYLLTSLVLNHSIVLTNYLPKNQQTKFRRMMPNVIFIAYKGGYILWGSLIYMNGITCSHKLKGTLLYNISGVQYMLDMISLLIVILNTLYLNFIMNQTEAQVILLAGALNSEVDV